MDKRQRVRKVVRGESPDVTPAGFWYHFDESRHSGDAAVKAHLDFLEATDVDLLKIMNENLYRVDDRPIVSADWTKMVSLPMSSPLHVRQRDVVTRVLDAVSGSAYTLATIHGIFASGFHALGLSDDFFSTDNPVEHHIRDDACAVGKGLRAIGESLLELASRCVDAGVDGIYYAALGGESYRGYTNAQFETAIGATEKWLLGELKKLNADVFVHICKDRVDFSRYEAYPGDVFNWATHSNDLTLKQGHDFFGAPILGGFDDRSGTLVDGTHEQIERETHRLLRDHADIPFLLGADCTLPTGLDTARIRTAVDAAHRYGTDAAPIDR